MELETHCDSSSCPSRRSCYPVNFLTVLCYTEGEAQMTRRFRIAVSVFFALLTLFFCGLWMRFDSTPAPFRYWSPVLLLFLLSVAPWIPWSRHFSLRTLFIATTLLAVLLGLIMWLAS